MLYMGMGNVIGSPSSNPFHYKHQLTHSLPFALVSRKGRGAVGRVRLTAGAEQEGHLTISIMGIIDLRYQSIMERHIITNL